MVGKTAQIIKPSEPMAFGAFMAIYRSCANSFIELFLNSPVFRRNLDGVSTTTINQITQNNLRSTVAPVPPMQEWQRIITKANELMALCDQLEQEQTSSIAAHQTLVETLLTTLTDSQNAAALAENWALVSEHFDTLFTTEDSIDQLKQTLLQLAVMGRLVPQNPKDEPASALLERIAAEKVRLVKEKKIKRQKPLPAISDAEKTFNLPDGWEWCRLAELVPQFQNGASSRGDKDGKNTVVLRLADIKNWQVSLEDTRSLVIAEESVKRYSLEKDDVLIIRVNGSADIVGRFITCHRNYDAIYCDHFIRMRFPIDCFNSEYLALLGSSKLIRNNIANLFVSTAGQKTVNQTHIGSLPVTLPPLQEQHRIVTKVNQLMRLCDHLKQMVQQANTTQSQLTDAIVEQALNPEPVNNAERDAHILRRAQDEPGSVAYS